MVHAVDSLEREIERQLADYRMNGGKRRLVDRLGDGKKGGWNRDRTLEGRRERKTLGSTIAEISRDGSYRGECIISRYNAVL